MGSVNQDCFDEFELMKQKRNYYAIVYKLSTDLKSIEIDTKFENPTCEDGDTIAAEYKSFPTICSASKKRKNVVTAFMTSGSRRAKEFVARKSSSSLSAPRTPGSNSRWCILRPRTRSKARSKTSSMFRPTTHPISLSNTSSANARAILLTADLTLRSLPTVWRTNFERIWNV